MQATNFFSTVDLMYITNPVNMVELIDKHSPVNSSNSMNTNPLNTPNSITITNQVSTIDLRSTTDLEGMIKLAEDNRTDAQILEALSCHDDVRVRAAVADNPNLPYASLLALARDESHDIRYQLAENHNVPAPVISILTEDENPYVRLRAESTLNRLGITPAGSPNFTVQAA